MIGMSCPRIALVAAVEKVQSQMPATSDAAILTLMGQRGEIPECIIEGPLSLDLALSRDAAESKRVVSDVSGRADILVVPSIETGNVFYKTLTNVMGKAAASVVVGANAPFVVCSRSDSRQTKLYSVALSALLTQIPPLSPELCP
jgi:phosphate butyryltransferase